MTVVRFRMRAACVVLALLVSACGTAEAVVEPTPIPVSSVPAAVPPPPIAPPEPEVAVPPPAPLPAPLGSIDEQSVYPVLSVTEWTLSNGMVVVYKRLREAPDYRLRAVAQGGWASVDSQRVGPIRWSTEAVEIVLDAHERRIDAQGEDLDNLLERVVQAVRGNLSPARVQATSVDVLDGRAEDLAFEATQFVELASLFADPAALTVVLVGPGNPVLVESAAGRVLEPIRATPGLRFDAAQTPVTSPRHIESSGVDSRFDLAIRIPSRAGDEAALQVLRGALEASLNGAELGPVHVAARRISWTDSAWLRVWQAEGDRSPGQLEASVREALAGDALYVSSARRSLLRTYRSPTPEHWLDAVTQLYRDGGGRQPGQNPDTLSPLSAPLTRVTDSDVLTLARRFAVSTDTAMILAP